MEPEGIIEHRHFRRVHQSCLHEEPMLDLVVSGRHAANTTVAFRADTDVTLNHDELMWRIEDAAKNQTARNPESTVLDSMELNGNVR